MQGLKELLLRIAAWLAAVAVWLIGLLLILEFVLPRLAALGTAFVGTPGGLILLFIAWHVLKRKKSH